MNSTVRKRALAVLHDIATTVHAVQLRHLTRVDDRLKSKLGHHIFETIWTIRLTGICRIPFLDYLDFLLNALEEFPLNDLQITILDEDTLTRFGMFGINSRLADIYPVLEESLQSV